ncbi:MAG: toll/interleukin-1 receptor domain-containing protein [Bryobacteraceae bacterium]|nr:toll/interleukin-1 receptor domain-containing protein [Bryobacteraceae bacterium]
MSPQVFGEIVRRFLESGSRVEIDGLGLFRLDAQGQIRFAATGRPRVFIAYVHEDAAQALRLYRDLEAHGLAPWMDTQKLLPGQNWPRAIEEAISVSDYFIACLSTHSVLKRSQFQAELRYALDCADRMPLGHKFLLPVRFDACQVPARIQKEIQYVDLFPDWRHGLTKLLAALGYSGSV